MKRARIIAKDHWVMDYTVNGRIYTIADKHDNPSTRIDKEIFHAIDQVGFGKQDLIDYFEGLRPKTPILGIPFFSKEYRRWVKAINRHGV